MTAPVIAAVNGTAGAGFPLPSRPICNQCRHALRHGVANAGLSPDGSSTYFLLRRVRPQGRELMLTNRMLKADEAMARGLVNEVVPARER